MEEKKTAEAETPQAEQKAPQEKFRWVLPVLNLLGGVGGVGVMFAAGYELGVLMSSSARTALAVVGLVLLAMLPILLVVNLIAAQAYKARKTKSMKETQALYLSRREEACRDLVRARKLIRRLRYRLLCYTLFMMYVGLYLPFACGAWLAEAGAAARWCLFLLAVPVYLLYAGFGRIPPQEYTGIDFSRYSNPEDYPTLHTLAKNVAQSLGLKGKIRIRFLEDCNAGIARFGRTYSLQLGVKLLDMMSEEELHAILLHEFSHLLGENPSSPEHFLFWCIAERERAPLTMLHSLLFVFPEVQYVFEYILYRAASSTAIETVADRAMAEHGDAQSAANALAKLAYYDFFDREFNLHVHEHFYAPEALRKDFIRPLNEAFRRAYAQRADFWRTLLQKEIEPQNASHPILRTRLQTLGVSEFSTDFPKDAGSAYRAECESAIKLVNRELYEACLPDYAEYRKRYYLDPLATIESWNMSDDTLSAEEARPVIDALWSFARYDELQTLCRRLLKSTDNKFATAHAEMRLGTLLLLRYDPEGAAHVWRAIELNHNYIDEGLESLGTFYCVMGLQKELEDYRVRAMELSQEQNDVYSQTGKLTRQDELCADTMPDDMRRDILRFLWQADATGVVKRVSLVRKVISEDFFTSVFVLEFLPDSDDEACEAIYDKFFNHLDTRPEDWQFSLFVYDETLTALLKRVKGCVSFERGQVD